MPKTEAAIHKKISAWYGASARELPWRAPRGSQQNPYYVWISEIMLQQTTVPAVMKYFTRFVARFPTLESLAAAPLDDVLQLWQGLGYYARARNLHKCAAVLVRDYGGKFPTTKTELMELPGIGNYTAGAIASIAFDRPEYAVDANVERVLARLFAVTDPLPQSKKQIFAHAEQLTPQQSPGDYLQAMMDLGSSICVLPAPRCPDCPIKIHCLGYEKGIAADLPRKIKDKQKPVRYGQAFIVLNKRNQILLRKRSGKSMLGDMIEVPSSDWDKKSAEKKQTPQMPDADWRKQKIQVRHGFTHFDLRLDVYMAPSERKLFTDGFWQDLNNLDSVALPTLFKKVIRQSLPKK